MIQQFDEQLTLGIHQMAERSNAFEKLVIYGGLVPYELYVLPGMAAAIIYAMVYRHTASLRFHVIPHVFAYSLVGLLKHVVLRGRPGCFGPSKMVESFEMRRKCGGSPRKAWKERHGFAYLSFPSGHACVAWSVLMGLLLFLWDSSETKWTSDETRTLALRGVLLFLAMIIVDMCYGRKNTKPLAALLTTCLLLVVTAPDLNDASTSRVVQSIAIGIALLTALHRIAKGYHHVLDSIAGMILGASVGYLVYHMVGTPDAEDFLTGPLGLATRGIVTLVACVYIVYFVRHTLSCKDKCTLDKLAGLEH